jgi:phosphatidate cytidylyltransferase
MDFHLIANSLLVAQEPAEPKTVDTTVQDAAAQVAITEPWLNPPTLILLTVVLAILGIAFVVGQVLRKQPESSIDPRLITTFNSRVRAWWMMAAILIAGFLLRYHATVILFGFVSFWALREFVTMTPTRRADHRALFWTFFLFTPAQYVFVGLGREYYLLYSILIPVYGSLFIFARTALSGDHKRFLERTAKIQAGLLICVYALSYAPALLNLQLEKTIDGEEVLWHTAAGGYGSNAGLLFYFILIVQVADVCQFAWDKLLGNRVIAPEINASRTWEGFVGGMLSATLVGAALWWVTPFKIWEAAFASCMVAMVGFCGGMVMSAIKRDRGVRDFGTLVQGHAGVLDRIDSVCFAAPIFFHVTWWFAGTSSPL